MSSRPTLDHWSTGITRIAPGEIAYRGESIEEIIEEWSFPATVWLLITGVAPTPAQEDALRRVLVAACDHGLAAPSIAAARICASTRGAPGAAMAAGLLAFSGPAHGGAAGTCARVLNAIRDEAGAWPVPDDEVTRAVAARLTHGGRIPGFGHPYHARDPRVPGLMAAALPDDGYRELARGLERALVAAKGSKLRMNADAAVAAVLLDAGFAPEAIDLTTTIGRCVGLAAHVHEEVAREAPFRAPSLDTIRYTGPAPAPGAS
jgi:citrate synthase